MGKSSGVNCGKSLNSIQFLSFSTYATVGHHAVGLLLSHKFGNVFLLDALVPIALDMAFGGFIAHNAQLHSQRFLVQIFLRKIGNCLTGTPQSLVLTLSESSIQLTEKRSPKQLPGTISVLILQTLESILFVSYLTIAPPTRFMVIGCCHSVYCKFEGKDIIPCPRNYYSLFMEGGNLSTVSNIEPDSQALKGSERYQDKILHLKVECQFLVHCLLVHARECVRKVLDCHLSEENTKSQFIIVLLTMVDGKPISPGAPWSVK